MNYAPHRIWQTLLPVANSSKSATRKRHYFNEVLAMMRDKLPDLYYGQRNLQFSSKETESFIQSLRPENPDHVFKLKVRFFALGIVKGQKFLGWQIPTPQVPIIASREPSKFTSDSFIRLSLAQNLEDCFLQKIETEPGSRTSYLGKILLSAMLYSGLVDKKWCGIFLEQVNTSFSHDTNNLWLQLKPKNAENGTKLLFLDPITRVLIHSFRCKHPEPNQKLPAPQTALSRYLQETFSIYEHTLRNLSFNHINVCCISQLNLKVPSFLSSYATGDVRSTSLPTMIFTRIVSDKALAINKIQQKRSITADRKAIFVNYGKQTSVQRQYVLFRSAMKSFPQIRPGKKFNHIIKSALTQFYEHYQQEMSPLLVYLLAWGCDLLTNYERKDLIPGRRKRRLHTNTVYEYLSTIGTKLITVGGEFNFEELEPHEIEEIYLTGKELCLTSKNQIRYGQCIYQFHQFLVSRYKLQQISFNDITEHGSAGLTTVSANLITYKEFEKIVSVLIPKGYHRANRYTKIQYLIFLLAFRCGLRQTEILKIRIIDTHCLDSPTLLIRANKYAGIKSTQAKRQIPIFLLLETDELDYFLEWRKTRFFEDNGKISQKNLLFCEIGHNDKMLPNNIISTIQVVMRQVTGDNTLQLRHLRHSFATWMTFRLITDFDDKTKSDYNFLDHPAFSPGACKKIRVGLLGTTKSKRKALYTVAQLCGHATPATTLLHYIHLCDWMLGQELFSKQNEPLLNAKKIAILTGKTKNQVYYRYKATKEWRLSHFLPQTPRAQIESDNIKLITPDLSITKNNSEESPLKIPWQQINMVLDSHYQNSLAARKIATRYDIDEHNVSRWICVEKTIKAMKTPQGAPKHIEYRFRKSLERSPLLQLQKRQQKDKTITIFFKKISQCNDQFELIKKNVNHFINYYTAGSKGVFFSDIPRIDEYLNFLKIVGIDRKQVHIDYNSNSGTPFDLLEKIDATLRRTNVPRKNIHHSTSNQPFTFWIQVKASGQKQTAQRYGSSEFKFCMYITAIALGISGKGNSLDFI